jgi:hypothetical protein
MWVSKAHYELIQQQLAESRSSAEAQVRQRDQLIAALREQLRTNEAERRELQTTMLDWQRIRMAPVEVEKPQPETWAERMEREIAEMQNPENHGSD